MMTMIMMIRMRAVMITIIVASSALPMLSNVTFEMAEEATMIVIITVLILIIIIITVIVISH